MRNSAKPGSPRSFAFGGVRFLLTAACPMSFNSTSVLSIVAKSRESTSIVSRFAGQRLLDMTLYRDNPQAIRALVRADSVHRNVYVDSELFDVEMQQLWRNTWIYVGHDSQVPAAGDFYTTLIGREPVLMIRASDDRVRVLSNRCAHKGTKLVSAVHGTCRGGMLRCPYHGWTYRLNGNLRTVPLKGAYEGTGFDAAAASRGLPEFNSVNYRG